MLQLKIFSGLLADVVAEFNAWAASLAPGTNLQYVGPTVTLAGDEAKSIEERTFMKEVMYVSPVRSNGKIEVPHLVPPKDLVH